MHMSQVKEGRRSGFQALIALLCALMLALGTMLPTGTAALADEEDTSGYTITVNSATAGGYSAYQLFSGSFTSDDSGTYMGDAVINSDVASSVCSALDTAGSTAPTGYDTWTAYYAANDVTDVAKANAIADAIAGLNDAQSFANVLGSLLGSATAAATTSVETDGDTATLSVSSTGYYIVLQTPTSSSSATSAILVPVTSDGASVTAKASTPTVTKSVSYADAGNAITWNSDGTASLSYTVTGTVASNYASFSYGYYYAFQDTLPAGVSTSLSDDGTLSNITWSVAVDDTDVTGSFTPSVSTVTNDDGSTQYVVTWACSDLTKVSGVSADSNIVLTYTLVLDSSEVASLFAADSSYDELTNTVSVVFANDPTYQGDGDSTPTGTSTSSSSSVSYYTLTVKKVDTNGSSLSGAAFTLTDASGNVVCDDVTSYSDDTATIFVFNGLEAGVSYTLTETTTPDGYKSIDPIVFSFTASETDGSASLSVSESSDPSGAASITADADAGGVTATVTNTEGVDLPLTGQQGIMLGLLIGAAIIAVSCAAIARNRRKDAEGAHTA